MIYIIACLVLLPVGFFIYKGYKNLMKFIEDISELMKESSNFYD